MNTDRRHDRVTAERVREALALQQQRGFESAFQLLRGCGLNAEVAIRILYREHDRRTENLGGQPH